MKIATALASKKLLYLDSAPVIYYVEAHVVYKPLLDWIFRNAQPNGITFVTGPVTLAECLVLPFRNGDMNSDRFSLTDAFQIATALSASCDAVLTNDLQMKKVTEIPILILEELEL